MILYMTHKGCGYTHIISYHTYAALHDITRGMQSIVGRAELAIDVQPHRQAAELSGLLHIVLMYEVGIR